MILLDDKTFHAALAPIRSESIGDVWHMPVNVDGAWRNVEVVDVLNRLVAEYDKLRAEAKRADEEATKLANSDLATTEQVIRALRVENDALRAKVRTITEHYKPGWVDGLKAVARSAGFDPDDAPHDGVDPPKFIEDVIDLLRRDVRDLKDENERLREACTLALEDLCRYISGVNPEGTP